MHYPITRAVSRARDNLVSEKGVMSDFQAIHNKLKTLMAVIMEVKLAQEHW